MATPLSPNLSWDKANPIWAASLNPVIANPLNGISILQNIKVFTGKNIINHGLGRLQQGWFLTDLQGNITLFRSAPFNSNTLILTSSGNATLSIGVF